MGENIEGSELNFLLSDSYVVDEHNEFYTLRHNKIAPLFGGGRCFLDQMM